MGLKPTVLFPGSNGGANWGGASYDPETRTLYVNSMDVGMLFRMVKRPEGSLVPYRNQGSGTPRVARFFGGCSLLSWSRFHFPPTGESPSMSTSKRRRWSIGSFSSEKALASSRPATMTSNRSTRRGSWRWARARGETSSG